MIETIAPIISSGEFSDCLPLSLFCFDTEGSVGHSTKPFFGYQLTGFPADTVCFVFNSYQRSLEMLDEFKLALSQFTGFLL